MVGRKGGGGAGGGDWEEKEEIEGALERGLHQMRRKCGSGFLGSIHKTFQELMETAVVKY